MATDTKNKVVALIDEAKSVLNATAWKSINRLAKAYEDADTAKLLAQINFGREAGTIIDRMVERGGDKKAAMAYFVEQVNEKRPKPYEASHVATWIGASAGYDSLTAKQRAAFGSLDVFRKLFSIPEAEEGQETRQQFVDRLISAGVTGEAAVRKAVVAEKKRRSGKVDNPAETIRVNSGKVAAETGKSTVKLATLLPNGTAAKLFLAGMIFAAKQVTKQPGFNVKSYEDGFKEALHPLTIQPAAEWKPVTKKAPAKETATAPATAK